MISLLKNLYKKALTIFTSYYLFFKRLFLVLFISVLILIPVYFIFIQDDKNKLYRLKKHSDFIQTYIRVINNLDITEDGL